MNNMSQREGAEMIGTAIIAFAATGGAVIGGGMGALGAIGLGSAGAGFGLFLAYAIFHRISGAHFNPAVSIGMWLAGKMEQSDAISVSIKQIIGAVGGYVLAWLVQLGLSDFDATGLPGGGYGVESGYLGVLLLSIFATAVFVLIYLYIDRLKSDNSAIGDLWKTMIVSSGFGVLNAMSMIGINIALIVVLFIGSIADDAGPAIVGLVLAIIGNVVGAVIAGQAWKMATGEGSSIDDIKGSVDQMRGGGGSSQGGDDTSAE